MSLKSYSYIFLTIFGSSFLFSTYAYSKSCLAFFDIDEVETLVPGNTVVSIFDRPKHEVDPMIIMNRMMHRFANGEDLRIEDLDHILTHLLSLKSMTEDEATIGVKVALELVHEAQLTENVFESLSKFYLVLHLLEVEGFEGHLVRAEQHMVRYITMYPKSERAKAVYLLIAGVIHKNASDPLKLVSN